MEQSIFHKIDVFHIFITWITPKKSEAQSLDQLPIEYISGRKLSEHLSIESKVLVPIDIDTSELGCKMETVFLTLL